MALYQYIEKKAKKILENDMKSLCNIVINSFKENSVTEAINLILNPETNP